jgi:hypothetical protein
MNFFGVADQNYKWNIGVQKYQVPLFALLNVKINLYTYLSPELYWREPTPQIVYQFFPC